MSPIVLLASIIVFFVVSLTITNFIQRKRGNTVERELPPPAIDLSEGCCGAHEVCEKDSLIAAFEEKPEYFHDEELDKYSFRDSSSYKESEVEEFREVFYTVMDHEKPRWVRSLQLRSIAVPDQLKDEVLMFVNELRMQKMHA